MDGNNDLIAFYVYDGAGLVAKVTSASEYYYYHYDGLGSTVAITDENAQIVNAYAYSPYGLVGSQETVENPFQYVGRFGVMAEGNGLYYMRARYYDPEVGRFINKDPIGYTEDINLYRYVVSNPVNWIDPAGLIPLHEIFLKVEEKLSPLVVAGGLVVTGAAAATAGAYAIVKAPVLAPFLIIVVAGGELLVMEGTTVYLNYINANFGTNIPTLSDFYPDLFPRYGYWTWGRTKVIS